MVRKLSVLVVPLLLAGFVLAIAPQAASASAKKSAAPELRLSENARGGTYHFSVNGKSYSLVGGTQRLIRGRVGTNRIVETRAPALYFVKSISVTPARSVVSRSLREASVSLNLKSGTAAVAYANAKVASGGGGTIKVCKNVSTFEPGVPSDPWTLGSFEFSITSGGATQTTIVAVGTCQLVTVAGSTATIVETEPSPYVLSSVWSVPSVGVITSTDLATATVTIAVSSTQVNEVDFHNDPELGALEACKTLASNAGALVGTTFTFSVTWTFQPSNSTTSVGGSGTIDVTPTGTGAAGSVCVPYWELLPVGSQATITENETNPGNTSTSVAIIPASADNAADPSSGNVANVILAPGGTSAMFTNTALGWIEICKDPIEYYYSYSIDPPTFEFSVNGSTTLIPVAAGSCSAPIQVPAGTATVAEETTPGYFFVSASTVAADDPTGARLVSPPGMNPATVDVPYGGVGNETVVTVTNHTDGAQLKICLEQDSENANVAGTFKFRIDGIEGIDGSAWQSLVLDPSSSNPLGLVCGLISNTFNNELGNSFSIQIAAQSGVSNPATIVVDSITTAGAVTLTGPIPPQTGLPQTYDFTIPLGQSENVVTFSLEQATN